MESYLRTDGILVVKLIRNNCGVNSTTEVVECLFTCFQKLEQKRRHVDDDAAASDARFKDAGAKTGNDAAAMRKQMEANHAAPIAPSTASRLPPPQLSNPLYPRHQHQNLHQQQQPRLPYLKMLQDAPSDKYAVSNDSQPPPVNLSIHGTISPSSTGLRSRFHEHHNSSSRNSPVVDRVRPGESTSV